MTNIYFDTEFTGLHQNTTLISLGLVSNDSYFYAEFTDYDSSQCDDWIKENVLSKLKFPISQSDKDYKLEYDEYPIIMNISEWSIDKRCINMRGNTTQIKAELELWLDSFNDDLTLVSDVCHYDMILFISIFGSAFDLPKNVSPSCYDINQDISTHEGISIKEAFNLNREEFVLEHRKQFLIESDNDKHNSLWDAKIIQEIYKYYNN